MDLKRIIIGLFISSIVASLLIFLPANSLISLFILLFLSSISLCEFYLILNLKDFNCSKMIGCLLGIIFLTTVWICIIYEEYLTINPNTIMWSITVISVMIIFYNSLLKNDVENSVKNIFGTLVGFIYISFLFSFLIRIILIDNNLQQPAWIAFYAILSTKLADTGGYFIGSKFGKHTLAKKISPKKTWEGFIGSILFCMICNLIWYKYININIGHSTLPLIHAFILSFLFPIFGTAGDLVESLFKRSVDIKDSGTFAKGLGGILDMIDSILFTAPMFYIYFKFLLA